MNRKKYVPPLSQPERRKLLDHEGGGGKSQTDEAMVYLAMIRLMLKRAK